MRALYFVTSRGRLTMIDIRPAAERGGSRTDWLDSRHTFSFADYHDPAHMGFRALRVINDDRVAPAAGFPPHGHADMEILSYVLEGGLEHRDSLGTGSVIRPGDVQRMSAGTGVRHSEFNASATEPVHFLQIWIVPERRGFAPGYEQKRFSDEERRRRLRLIVSRDGRDGSVTIHQDVNVYAGLIDEGERTTLPLAPGRHAWVQVARGAVTLSGSAAGGTGGPARAALSSLRLGEGDGAAVSGEAALALEGHGAEVLAFDLA
jgi:redox-sensitive bicupin YhaK (pirin superfamily)